MSTALIAIITTVTLISVFFLGCVGYYMYKSYHFLGRAVEQQQFMDSTFFPKLLEHFNRTIECVEHKREKIGINPKSD